MKADFVAKVPDHHVRNLDVLKARFLEVSLVVYAWSAIG